MTQSGLADLYKRLWFFWGGERGSRIGVLQLPLADQLFLRAALVMRLAEAHMCVTGHAELGADGKDYVPTQCTPPFPKNQHSKRPLTGAWFGGCQPGTNKRRNTHEEPRFDDRCVGYCGCLHRPDVCR